MKIGNLTAIKYIAKHNPVQYNWFPFVFSGILLTVSSIQLVLMSVEVIPPTGAYDELWKELIWIGVQMFTGVLGIFGLVLTLKGKRTFFYFSGLSLLLIVIINLSLSLWMGALEMLLQVLLSFRTFLIWKKQDDQHTHKEKYVTKANKKDWLIASGIIGFFLLVGYLMANFTEGSPFETSPNKAWFDSILVSMAIVQVYFVGDKRRESQMFMLISNIGTMVMFALLGQWTIFAIVALYFIPTISGFSSWYVKEYTGEPL